MVLCGILDCFKRTSTEKDKFDKEDLIKDDKMTQREKIPLDRQIEIKRKHTEFDSLKLSELKVLSTLGLGAFGRVELVQIIYDPTRSFALKKMKKNRLVSNNQQKNVFSEKEILLEADCDFIVKIYRTFKDDKNLYILLEPCLGGDLYTIFRSKKRFNEDTTRFYIGCVMEALEYLHSRKIVYRDLKTENLLLDNNGYLKLTDFGFAKKLGIGHKSLTWTCCGTADYMAPEVILGQGHNATADYWSLGVLIYDLITGVPPFEGRNCYKTCKNILRGIKDVTFPRNMTRPAKQLIIRLCRSNRSKRLGANRGVSEIRSHKWFKGFNWKGLRTRTLPSPYIPKVLNITDTSNFDIFPPDYDDQTPDFTGWDADF